ncbi:ribonuclease III [Mycoplasmopsis alligatoris]|uniref:Ribonuclease 3 n=1 Tax=Mycoplasmopsis alligatoris A21JP2 TaxID=747682 RepID=D4XWC4_9BACT|nr:ribonuclease III [Mycoplasmopsis alligatoris]EFF41245.1 ribonuclease III [Mycoplasmopsis alligatoris A21JP2]
MIKCTNFDEFFKYHEIEPKNKLIYFQALKHGSFVKKQSKLESYERLEFLGDSVLQLFVSSYIYTKFPNMEQGKMTELRAKVVNANSLSQVSNKIGLINLLKTGGGQTAVSVKSSTKVQSDIFESIIGAIFVDLGLNHAYKFIRLHLSSTIDNLFKHENKDPKTRLQEYFQNISRENIKYIVDQLPNKSFSAKATHDKIVYGIGKGSSKKESEINAALEALKKLNIG